MGDERVAQDQLTNNWSQYSRAHKTQCVGMTTSGGPSSYVELISCLDIMKDAAAISDLLISDGCDWSGVIAKLFAKSMRPTRKAG